MVSYSHLLNNDENKWGAAGAKEKLRKIKTKNHGGAAIVY